MKTTTSPQGKEDKKEVRPGLTENYTPAANVFIRGFSELSISERYVAIGLVSLYWDEKVYPVSLRELASKIQVDHTTLRSRGGKRPAEGILDKLWRVGIIGLMEGKPLTETGNKGRVQTYILVNHSFIAERNRNCLASKGTKTPRYSTVGNTNDTVGVTNHTVGNTNTNGGNTNHTVVHSSVEVPPKNNKNISNNPLRQERENSDCASAPSQSLPNASSLFEMLPWLSLDDPLAPTKIVVNAIPADHPHKEYEQGYRAWTVEQIQQSLAAKGISVSVEYQPSSYSQEYTQPTLPGKTEQESAGGESDGYMQSQKPTDKPEKTPRSNRRTTNKSGVEQEGLPLQVDLGPLVMPDQVAPWNAGTAVLISEVLRNRAYTPKAKEDQLTAARKMFKEFPTLTRNQFEEAFTQRNDDWWRSHVGLLTIADLMAKDNSKAIRLSKILERIVTKPAQVQKSSQQKTAQTAARPGSWRERYERDPNNGGYQEEASLAAFEKAGEEIYNAARQA